jgi:hypothetical protein
MSDIRVMNELDMISLKNLMLLSKNRDNEEFRWFVEGAEIRSVDSDNDSYDTGNTCCNLEYPCLLMFHQLFRFLDDSNRVRFKKYSQRELLNLMEHALESLYQILNASDEPKEDKERLTCMLKEFDDKHSFYHEFFNSESICIRLGLWVSETLDQIVEIFSESRGYLYLTPMTLNLGRDHSSEEEDEDATESESEEGGGYIRRTQEAVLVGDIPRCDRAIDIDFVVFVQDIQSFVFV